MKITIGLVSLAVLLAGSPANAVAVHNNHKGLQHAHHFQNKVIARAVEVRTQTVTLTVVVNQNGEIVSAPTDSPKENGALNDIKVDPKPTPTPKIKEPPVPSPPPKVKPPPKPDSGNSDPDSEFPDGEVDCSTFPSQWGAVPVDWLDSDGWTGLQYNGGGGEKCIDGTLCSYACPPGYSKGQWPEFQPASGESHGGLLCKNGKLFLTRPETKTLCVKGHGGVFIRNKLSKHVAVCRTDYPGCESMVVPLSCAPGSTQELTVPIAEKFYTWRGKETSAQYYVNPAGLSIEEGCIWGKPGGGIGNWAPMIIGAGYSKGIAWLSISQNQLNDQPLNFNIKIVGDADSELNGDCKYENGVFSGGGPGEKGCTAALKSGTAYFELY